MRAILLSRRPTAAVATIRTNFQGRGPAFFSVLGRAEGDVSLASAILSPHLVRHVECLVAKRNAYGARRKRALNEGRYNYALERHRSNYFQPSCTTRHFILKVRSVLRDRIVIACLRGSVVGVFPSFVG